MTDLQINVALAQSMGWQDLQIETHKDKVYIRTGYPWPCCELEDFDYRDPTVFVAICKRWKLTMVHGQPYCYCRPALRDFYANTIEKAAALCVIDAVKRGAK